MLGGLELWAAEPEIAVRGIAGNRYHLTVMEADGSNPTRLIVKRPNSGRPAFFPSWSPEGDWIAYTDRDVDSADAVFKIPAGGGEPTRVLCGAGAGRDFEYDSLDYVRWSPDGQWLLVRASKISGEYWLGVVASTQEVVGGNCTSDLKEIYYVGWDGLLGEGWWSWNGPTWNSDGSKIAIFEFYEDFGDIVGWRLQILHVDYDSGEPSVFAESPILLADPDGHSLSNVNLEFSGSHPDWQRQSGSLLTFTLIETDPWVNWLCWIDTDTGAWDCWIEGNNASWSPDNSRIVFNLDDGSLVLADVSYEENVPSISNPWTIGDGRWPDWRRSPAVAACSTHVDCDDHNPCTDDICIAGVCETSDNAALCDDGNPCTYGDACGGGLCRGTSFDGWDSGCDGWCCDGDCLEGANSCNCAPKGAPCSTDSECCSNSCHPIKATCK